MNYGSYNFNKTFSARSPFEKQHRTVRCVCLNCLKLSSVTVYAPYREALAKEKCMHCETAGKLNTSELSKSRVKKDNSQQLTIPWNKK